MGRAMSIGMTGEDVRVLQQLLNHHLSPPLEKISEDGMFGALTRARVIEFQKRNRDYPSNMPIPAELGPEFKRPLVADGIVGALTANVMFDARTLKNSNPGQFKPVVEVASSSAPVAIPVSDPTPTPPAPTPTPTPPPARVFRLVQLSIGQQVTVNPWSLSPFVFTGQYVMLAKNDGRPDFLLTAGGQAAMNDGGANGRWTAQPLFFQMGLGGFDNLKLFGGKLDWFNPFVSFALQRNFNNNLTGAGPFGVAEAIGNQATWTLASKPLPGTKDDMQDTLSFAFNAQAVTVTSLSTGRNSAVGGQFLLSAIKTFAFF